MLYTRSRASTSLWRNPYRSILYFEKTTSLLKTISQRPPCKNMAIVIPDSFLLRGIYPPDIEEKLESGGFSTISLPKEKITIIGGQKPKGVKEKEQHENVYTFWTNKEVSKTIGVSRAPGDICDWCRRRIKVVNGEKHALGMPILKPTEDGEIPQVGTYDTWNCMFADSLREESMPAHLKASVYRDSNSLIRHLFREIFPEKILSIAPHWSKLLSNGGYMSDEEYDEKLIAVSGMGRYKPLAYVILDQIMNR